MKTDLRDLLSTLTPTARDALRRVLILDYPDRDAIATELLHHGDQAGYDSADVIDSLHHVPGRASARRAVARGARGVLMAQ